MLNSKYVSIKTIVENVLRDNPIFAQEINLSDVLEWAWYAVYLIGVPEAFFDKVTQVDVAYYRGELPCDLVHLRAVREKITGSGMVHDSDLFYLMNRETALATAAAASYTGTESLTGLATGVFQVDANGYPMVFDDEDYLRSREQSATYFYTQQTYGYSSTFPYRYKLENDYIYTSFEEGQVEIAYQAFPTDQHGYPQIPDNARYIKAVESYVAERLARRLYLTDRLTQEKYRMFEQDWLFYVNSAANAARTPSIDKMESIKNAFLRAIPKINQHMDNMRFRGNPEQIYIRRS